MEKVARSLTQRKMQDEKTNVGTTKLIIEEDESLWQMFDNVARQRNIICDEKERKSLYKKLIKKVLNARITEEFRKYKEKYIVRKSSVNRTNLTMRGGLKAMTKPSQVKKEKKEGEEKIEKKRKSDAIEEDGTTSTNKSTSPQTPNKKLHFAPLTKEEEEEKERKRKQTGRLEDTGKNKKIK